MAAFLHPGVYVLEVGNPPRSIEAVSTSTAIFVGDTERGSLSPTKITSRTDYTRQFGGYLRTNTSPVGLSPTLAYAMDSFFGNGGTTCYVLRAMNSFATAAVASRTTTGTGWTVKLNASSAGVWANGTATNGVFAIILPPSDGSPNRFRIVVVFTPLDTNLQQIVEDWDRLSKDPNDENYVVDVLRRSLYIAWDPLTQPAVPTTFDGPAGLSSAQILALAVTGPSSTALTGGVGGNMDAAVPGDYQMSLLDDITDASLLVLPRVSDDSQQSFLNNLVGIPYVMNRPHKDLFFITSLSRHNGQVLATNAVQDAVTEFNAISAKTDFAALYFPWIQVADPVGVGKNPTIYVAPSATMAGVYARTDANRGVWKAPAGVEATLLGSIKLEFNIQDIQQDIMNPLGINALRNQPGAGNVSWGARTTVPSSQWRYIPVRRLAIFMRQSIYNGIQFAVFEGNDEPLWAALRGTIGGFMDTLYRQGAFAGGSPSEAYFVKCDAETTTPTDQLAGVVNILVGFSPLRPAEFVVVKLSQIVNVKA